MNPVDMLRALGANGIGLLEAIRGMSKDEVAALGLGSSTAGGWLKLAEVYLGPQRRKKIQRLAVERAKEGQLPVAALEVIEKQVNSLLDGDRWEVRAELCALRGSVDEIAQQAKAIVRELNEGNERLAADKRALKGGKNTDSRGCRTFTVTGPERDIEAFLGAVEKQARRFSPDLSYEQAMYDALLGGGGVAVSETLMPHVVIPLPEWAKLLRHEGEESIFALTDGTTMTGKELVEKLTDDHHVAGLYDPVEGPINLYRSQRRANAKQVAMLNAESIYCEWPECTTPAERCQTHHIDAWSNGGETNAGRMTKLCRKHNALNDDDPNAPPRHGRVEREGAEVVWSRGEQKRTNRHPVKRLSARAIAARGYDEPHD